MVADASSTAFWSLASDSLTLFWVPVSVACASVWSALASAIWLRVWARVSCALSWLACAVSTAVCACALAFSLLVTSCSVCVRWSWANLSCSCVFVTVFSACVRSRSAFGLASASLSRVAWALAKDWLAVSRSFWAVSWAPCVSVTICLASCVAFVARVTSVWALTSVSLAVSSVFLADASLALAVSYFFEAWSKAFWGSFVSVCVVWLVVADGACVSSAWTLVATPVATVATPRIERVLKVLWDIRWDVLSMCLITYSIGFCFGFFKPKLRGVESYGLLARQPAKKRLRAVLTLDGSG